MGAVSLTTVRYAAWCGCGRYVAVGDVAGYEHVRRRVLCLDCVLPGGDTAPAGYGGELGQAIASPGQPGASSWREYSRLRRQRQEDVRERWPHLGPAILSLSREPGSMRDWARASRGELRVGAALTRLADDWVYALHDRRIPGRRLNIDHIAVGPSGVFVIDTKHQPGPEVQVRPPAPGAFGLVERLLVCGRDRTDFLGAMQRQVMAVQSSLESLPDGQPVHVRPMLCFAHTRLPLWRRLSVDNVPIVGVRAMSRMVREDGPLDVARRYRIYNHLARCLPSMTG
ncbi:nuclease-related domain-containing protein [Oryzihumus sp.]